MVTFSSCLIWQIISFILPPNEYDCVYTWTMQGKRITEDADFGKKNHLFRWSSFWSWRLCKQAKLSHLGQENLHVYIEKPAHPKRVTVWCGVWSGVWPRGIIGPFFFENKQGEAVSDNFDRYRAMLNEFLFTKIEEDNIWFQQNGAMCHAAEATLNVWRPVLEDRIISRRTDVVRPPWSCDLTPLDY